MATVSDVQAQTSFTNVYNHFVDKGDPVVVALDNIAEAAILKINSQSWLSDGDLSWLLAETSVTAPTEPTQAETFQQAIDYLSWLDSQVPSISDLPALGDVVGTAPTEPTVDVNDITGRLSYTDVPPPVVDVPVWDESAAWQGDQAMTEADTASDAIPTPTYTEPTYTSPLLGDTGINVLYDTIMREIQDKSYGIDPLDEELLFQRMKDRETRQTIAAREDATLAFAAGGFSMPTGALASALNRIDAEMRDKLASANREITVARHNLYLEAKKIALANGLELNKQDQTFHNTVADRTLRAITEGVQSYIAIASQKVALAKMYLDKYVAFAQAFGERVKASTAVVDLYKSQVDAEKIKAEFNKSLVDELAAKNDAVVKTYDATVRGFAAEADSKTRYYANLVEAYKTQAAEIEYRARAMQGVYDLAETQMKSAVDFRIGKYNGDISSIKVAIERLVAGLNYKLEQYKNEIQAQTSAAAAAMAALNVNLGLSVAGSASVGGQESVSEDASADVVRVSHTYDKTKGDATSGYEHIDYHYTNET